MKTQATHIVQRLNLEIEVPHEALARRMYREAGALLQQYVLPELEKLLRQYEHEDRHIRIDRLTVDLDLANASSLEACLKQQLADRILEQVEAAIAGKDDVVPGDKDAVIQHSTAEQAMEAFLYFLQTGRIPWWFADPRLLTDSTALIGLLSQQEEVFQPVFIRQLAAKPDMLQRLVWQCDEVLLSYLFSLVAPLALFHQVQAWYEQLEPLMAQRPMDSQHWRQQYWSLIWQAFSPGKEEKQNASILRWRQAIDRLQLALEQRQEQALFGRTSMSLQELLFADIPFPGSLMPETLNGTVTHDKQDTRPVYPMDIINIEESSPRKERSGADEHHDKLQETNTEDGWLADHTGLILLHPFLQYFFMELGLLQEDRFVSDQAKATAVHLLHYLATGKEQEPDFGLLFEKYLCGMDADEVTYRYTELTERMKEEADSLLQATIRHWTALKNTSIDGLREGFLQRKGKLVPKGPEHKLYPEQHALDILLDRVPWNISLVKLPWLPQMIHVEWMK